jgi:hypothetical protein
MYLLRACVQVTLNNGMYALVDFGALLPKGPNGEYPLGFYAESEPNDYQRARGITRVYTYHSPGLPWNHSDVLHVDAAPKPMLVQPEVSIAQHGPYYTWPTKLQQLAAAHHAVAAAAQPANPTDFLQAYAATINAAPAPQANPAHLAIAPLEAFVPAFIPAAAAAIAAPPSSSTITTTSNLQVMLANQQAVTTTAAAVQQPDAPTIIPPTVTIMSTPPPMAAASSSSKRGKATGDFAPNFNVPNDEHTASTSEPQTDPTPRRQKPRTLELEDEASNASSSPPSAQQALLTDSDGTPGGPMESPQAAATPSDAEDFKIPTILGKKTTKRAAARKKPINKKLAFDDVIEPEPLFQSPGFDIKTLFETEAVEEKITGDIKMARRLLKKSKAQRKKAAASARLRKESDEALEMELDAEQELASEPEATPVKEAVTTGRLRKKKVIDLVDSDDDIVF